MIYTEQDLNIGANAFDIINESAWVDGQSIISPNIIPMVESSDIGGVVVRFSDVEALSEEYGVDYIDSMLAIAESNDLDPQYMAVAVDESELIVNPELIYELANVVVVPQSENSLAYQFCEACIDAYAESGDEDYLWGIINEAGLIKNALAGYGLYTLYKNRHDIKNSLKKKWQGFKSKFSKNDQLSENFDAMQQHQMMMDMHNQAHQQAIDNAIFASDLSNKAVTDDQQRFAHHLIFGNDTNHPYISKYWSSVQADNKNFNGPLGKTILKSASKVLSNGNLEKETEMNNFLNKIIKRADKMPKSWIGQKIAALRGLYLQYKDKWEMQKHIQPHKHNIFKTIADKILTVIDYLLEKLQNFAG